MAGELESIFLKIGAGDSVLVEGGAGSGKEFFCRLLLRQALDAKFSVAILSFHPEAHVAWFREYAGKGIGRVRHAEAPDNLTEIGIALGEQASGCRLAYVDFFEVLSAKAVAGDLLEAIAFNAKKLKAGKTSLLQGVNPESVDAQQMSRLRELFDIIIEVRRSGEKMEYRYRRHPREYDDEWHGFSLSETIVPRRTLPEFCHVAMEYELKVIAHYGRNFEKFDEDGRKRLVELAYSSMGHFRELVSLLQREATASKAEPAPKEELAAILDDGLLEERVMKERYEEYASESGDEKAAAAFTRLSGEEKSHEKIVEDIKKKL